MRVVGVGVVLLTSCAEGLDPADRIASVRTLGIRNEVVTDTDPDDPGRAEVLPGEQVEFGPLMVDPDEPLSDDAIEEDIEPIWIGCILQPIEGLFTCLSSKLPLDPDDVEPCVATPPGLPGGSEPTEDASPGVCRIDEGSPARPRYTVPLNPAFFAGADVEVTMIGHHPDRGSTEDCARDLLIEADQLSEDCIYAVQRLPIGPDRALIEGYLPPGIPPPADLPPDVEPDTHPRIQSFEVQILGADGELIEGPRATDRGDTIEVEPGQTLQFRTEAPQSDLQEYPIPNDDGYELRREAYAGLWFRTWGSLLGVSSNDPVSLNAWQMVPGEGDEIEGTPDRATLYYVLRDGRQGVDWWWLHVEIAASDSRR